VPAQYRDDHHAQGGQAVGERPHRHVGPVEDGGEVEGVGGGGHGEPLPPALEGGHGHEEQGIPGLDRAGEQERHAEEHPGPGEEPEVPPQHPGQGGQAHEAGDDHGGGAVEAEEAEEQEPGALAVLLLAEVAREVAEDLRPHGEDVGQVGHRHHGGRRPHHPSRPRAGQGGHDEPGQELHERAQAGQEPAEEVAAPQHGPQGTHGQGHAHDVDVGVHGRLHHGHRRPGHEHRPAGVPAQVAHDEDHQAHEPEGDEAVGELVAPLAGTVGEHPVEEAEPHLGGGRVDRALPGPVEAGAAGGAVEGGAGLVVGPEPVVAQLRQPGVGGGVAVGVDPRGLHPPVPGVAVDVVGELGPGGQGQALEHHEPPEGHGQGPAPGEPQHPPGPDGEGGPPRSQPGEHDVAALEDPSQVGEAVLGGGADHEADRRRGQGQGPSPRTPLGGALAHRLPL